MSMPLRCSFEKSEVRFDGGCTAERDKPSGMLIGGRESGDGYGGETGGHVQLCTDNFGLT
jgi:hypothetical protein